MYDILLCCCILNMTTNSVIHCTSHVQTPLQRIAMQTSDLCQAGAKADKQMSPSGVCSFSTSRLEVEKKAIVYLVRCTWAITTRASACKQWQPREQITLDYMCYNSVQHGTHHIQLTTEPNDIVIPIEIYLCLLTSVSSMYATGMT